MCVRYLYADELRTSEKPLCELDFMHCVFPHALDKREELNKGFVVAAIAVFQNQIGGTICLLCFPWSEEEVDGNCIITASCCQPVPPLGKR